MATKQELEEMLDNLMALHNGIVDILSDPALSYRERVEEALEHLRSEIIEVDEDWYEADDDEVED